MAAGKMKPLLARHKPVGAAIGLTAEGEGVILLHRKAKPKKVMAMLKAAAGKEKLKLDNASLRFGRAMVDPAYDPGMVRFFINKAAAGSMRMKLLPVVKEVPYQKVELNVDDGLELEPDDTAESLSQQLAGLVKRMGQVPDTDASLKARLATLATDASTQIKANDLNSAADFIEQLGEALDEVLGEEPEAPAEPSSEQPVEAMQPATEAPAPPAPPAPPKQPEAKPQLDADALKKELAGLMQRIPQIPPSDPDLKARAVKLATDANVQIKTNNLTYATGFIGQLREALDSAGGGAGQPAPPNAPVAEAKAEANAEATPAASTLTPRLTTAAQRIAQVLGQDPSRRGTLVALATDGQKKIAANDFTGALHAIEELEIALDAPVVAKETISANTGAVAYAKSRLAWLAVRKQMQGDINKLRDTLTEKYQGTPILNQIQASYNDRVSKKLDVLDESLADLLDDASNAADPTVRATKVQAARDKIAEYQGYVASESKLFDDLDSNPFVPLAIKATLTKTLATLSAAVR
ncbi:MAG TPA: hypothetical protein DDZ81_18395 [Acetobacteraceae bacterium]|jgi:hypothetical protein|nr:hypothetical protein [Acetobacteraceae bacterium]